MSFKINRIQTDQTGAVSARRVAHEEKIVSVPAMSPDIFPHPSGGKGDAFRKGGKTHFGIKAVISGYKDDSFPGELFADFAVIIFLAPSPTATMKEKNDRSGPADFRADDIQNLTFMLSVRKIQGFGYPRASSAPAPEGEKPKRSRSPKNKWGDRPDSNRRPPAPQAGALTN